MLRRKMGIAATLSAATLVSASLAKADAQSDRLAALEAEVAQLKGEKVDAAVTAAQLDAAKRDSFFMMADGSAGYDNGFYIQSSDGVNKVQPYAQLQFRYTLNSAGGVLNDDADIQDGFALHRTRVGLRGNFLSKDLSFDIRGAANRNGGAFELESAFIKYKFADNLSFRVGQWQNEVFKERGVGAFKQLAADRSMTDELIGGAMLDYIQGASLLYEEGNVRAQVSLTDGIGSKNSPYTNTGANFGVEGRFDYLVNGDFKDAQDFTAKTAKAPVFVVGGGFAWSQAGDDNIVQHTLDATWKQDAIALFAAYTGEWFFGGTDDYNLGVVAQAAYLLPDSKWELFGRVGYTLVNTTVTDEDDFWELTVGTNYYFADHNAKATVDLGFLPTGSPATLNAANYVGIEGESQLVLRGQFQFSF